jgi:predicted ATPase
LRYRLEKEYLAYRFKTYKAANKDKKVTRANDYFNEAINRLFEPSRKKLNEDDEKLSFLLEDNTSLDWTLLSSGEKQLLLILLTVLCQDEKPSVLLMDEPEISLHFSWQYELVKIIRTINPNCQLIIATHSVSIYAKGWMDKFFFIEEANGNGIRHKILETA